MNGASSQTMNRPMNVRVEDYSQDDDWDAPNPIFEVIKIVRIHIGPRSRQKWRGNVCQLVLSQPTARRLAVPIRAAQYMPSVMYN